MSEFPFTSEFFAQQGGASIESARNVVPVVMELIQPRSVVDVGCGTGTWLAVFAEHEVADYIGIDGDYVDRSQLLIPPERFVGRDLTKSVELDRRFDLAVSLEVAEHLPEVSARVLVGSLVRLAPVVLFSAAVPGQGGTHHVNEQWPSYWASLFAEHKFVPLDLVRPRIWRNEEVAWWYAQNTLIFANPAAVNGATRLQVEGDGSLSALDLVSRLIYEETRRAQEQLTTRQLLRILPAALRRSIAWRASGLNRSDHRGAD
jgi:SAM-dependent methyltransferase